MKPVWAQKIGDSLTRLVKVKETNSNGEMGYTG